MAGFSLGGGHTHPHAHTEIPPESLFLYRNVEISPYHTNKGLQLWHHNQQHQQQELQQDIFSGMTPGGPSRRTSTSEELPLRVAPVTIMTRQGSGGGGISCQDCGNQAKKDCPHLRCRTCCKSRGFQCQTHVKSTWVPASRRRERQQHLAAASMQHQQQQHKRPRENSAAAVAGHLACTRLPATTAAAAGLEVSNFPAEVNTPAVFRCVRVSSMDDGDQDLQYAYQAAVNIGGHVFKGILYDQGLDNPHYGHGESSSGGAGDGAGGVDTNRSLITVSTASTANTNAVTSTSTAAAAAAALLDPSSLFPVPFNAFMAGTQFFPHPRS